MVTEKKGTPASYYIKLLVCFACMFGFKYIPGWAGITPEGMAAIGIFIGLVLMIVFNFGLIASCTIAIFAVVNTGFYTGSTIITQTIGNASVVQMIFMYAVCNSMMQTGAGEFVAKWLLSRKWIQGRPIVFSCMMLFVGWLCGPFMGSAGLILLYGILDYVDDTLGYSHEDSFSMMLRLGAQSACMVGMAFLPFKGITLTIFTAIASALEAVGITTNFAYYMIGSAVIAVLYIAGFIFLMLAIFKCDASKIKNLDMTKMEGMDNLKATPQQIYSMVFTLLAIIYTLVSLVLPAGAFKTWYSNIALWVWAALMLGILSLIRYEGKPVINADALMAKLQWGIILATAAFTVIGGMLANKDLGVRGWIVSIMNPIFSNMSYPIFILVICFVAAVVTNFFSNMATGLIIGAIVAPFAVVYCQSLGVNGTFIALALVQSAMFAFLTMAAAGPAPMLLAQEAFVKKPSFIWTHGVPALIWGVICTWIVCLGFSMIM